MDIIQRLKIYLRRKKSNGKFFYPRSVHAHYKEIMHYLPDALTQEEKIYFKKQRNFEKETW